ncbi:SH3 domain-containing protein [Clostridium sp. A1-XYC3]|uniref:SH3 domain-containing protein n=1 Tax=Clostridium tanneri TaxID=3037988 RepID=A0ABU4JYA5_9CLOT|nr:SH3 domain-containing protein [Clostridium sp. A1-XYC3]MDW8803154.1 SH3 domain-containing protein [Clostridium sp. A1-XYC3]
MKSKKIISIVLSVSIATCSILGTSYAVKAATLHGIVSSKQGLNVRNESNSGAKIIGSLKLDESVEILETKGDWYKIKYGSSYGYVSKQYIALDKNPSSDSNPQKEDSNLNTEEKTPQYKNFIERKDVDQLKQWKIKFNRKIKDTESNKNEFKVIDNNGSFVSTKVLIDNYSVTVIPWSTSYNYGKNYKLIIGDNIESSDGIKIKYTSTMDFTIKSKAASLGLGNNETESVSNNKNFDWYIGQNDTGKYSAINSGPAAVAMAIKWTNPSQDKSVAYIRDTYESNVLAWNMNNIASSLKDSNIKYSSCDNISEDELKKQLKSGNILIVNLNPQYINYNDSSESRVGRFHIVDGSAYTVIIKGYKVVDGKTYFEIYDSFNINSNYLDGSPKGKNNYYPANEVLNSLMSENIHPIIVSKDN